MDNEFCVVAHHTFDKKEIEDETTFYIVYIYGEYSFINGVFADDRFVTNNPATITLKKVQGKENTYKVTKIFFQRDGIYVPEFSEMFSDEILDKYILENHTKEIRNKLHKKEKAYLKSIGRSEKIVDSPNLEYIMEEMEFSEKGYDYLNGDGFNSEFEYKGYPGWIGTIERLENGKRYIYKAEQEERKGGRYIITYSKIDENGKIINKYKVDANSKDFKVKKVV